MERAAFLIEATGERIGCLLNPESVVVKRRAGLETRRSVSGKLTGEGLADDPLLYTGGGQTELELELLFDVNVAGSTIMTADVQNLTRPLWQMTENASDSPEYGKLPLVRFVWGKSFNMPGVVSAVSERLEQFTIAGVPQRSWLKLRLMRVSEPPRRVTALPGVENVAYTGEDLTLAGNDGVNKVSYYETGGNEPNTGNRLDTLAYLYLGSPYLWRLIAELNDIADPNHIEIGLVLAIPAKNSLRRNQ